MKKRQNAEYREKENEKRRELRKQIKGTPKHEIFKKKERERIRKRRQDPSNRE